MGGSSQARTAVDWMKHKGASLIAEFLNGTQLSSAVVAAGEPIPEQKSPSTDACQREIEAPQDMNRWAEDWITRRLESLPIRLFGGSATAALTSPIVSGSAAICS